MARSRSSQDTLSRSGTSCRHVGVPSTVADPSMKPKQTLLCTAFGQCSKSFQEVLRRLLGTRTIILWRGQEVLKISGYTLSFRYGLQTRRSAQCGDRSKRATKTEILMNIFWALLRKLSTNLEETLGCKNNYSMAKSSTRTKI